MGSPVEMDLPVSIDRDQPLPGTKVLALVINPFVNDSRVLRENRTLAEHGYDVTLLALHESGLPVEESLFGFRVIRVPLRTRSWSKTPLVQLVKYAECAFRMFRAGYQIRPSVVHANDLNTLPIGFLISRLTGAALIYDSHEYWAGYDWHRFPRWSQRAALWIEQALARRARAVISVSPGIVDRLRLAFNGVPTRLVRNVPDRPPPQPLHVGGGIRSRLRLSAETPLLLFQGNVVPSRGVDVAVAAMAFLPDPIHLAILGGGPGDYLAALKVLAEKYGVSARVSFVPPVPSTDVVEYSRSADFGLSPLRSHYPSVELSLPNKVFEYLQSGLPIIHSGSDEVRRLLERYEVGCWFAEGDAAALAAVVQQWLANPAECARLREHCRRAAAELHWDNEQRELLAVYRLVAKR